MNQMYGFEGEVKSKYPFVPICCPLSDCSFSDVFAIKVFLWKCVLILTLCYIYCRYVWPLYRSVQLVASLSPYKPESAGKEGWFSRSLSLLALQDVGFSARWKIWDDAIFTCYLSKTWTCTFAREPQRQFKVIFKIGPLLEYQSE